MNSSKKTPSILSTCISLFFCGICTSMGLTMLAATVQFGLHGDNIVLMCIVDILLLSNSVGVVVCVRRLIAVTNAASTVQPISAELTAVPRTKLSVRSLYFQTEARCPRSTYWLLGVLPATVILWLSMIIMVTTQPAHFYWIFVVQIIVSVPLAMVGIKRLHDLDKSGWNYLLIYVPVISIWIYIQIGFFRGSAGWNRFGPNPV